MHRDGRSQGCKHQQGIEHHTNHPPYLRHPDKGLLKHVRQRDEDERRTTVGANAYREGSGEYHESCEDGYHRVEHHNLTG